MAGINVFLISGVTCAWGDGGFWVWWWSGLQALVCSSEPSELWTLERSSSPLVLWQSGYDLVTSIYPTESGHLCISLWTFNGFEYWTLLQTDPFACILWDMSYVPYYCFVNLKNFEFQNKPSARGLYDRTLARLFRNGSPHYLAVPSLSYLPSKAWLGPES